MADDLFFDTDCLSAFLWINDTSIIEQLYGGKIIIPGPVYQELSNPCVPHLKGRVDKLLDKSAASLQQIEMDKDEFRLYRTLIKGSRKEKAIGKGEAVGIALAKTYDGILASNNLKDIAPYIEKYELKHVSTGNILKEALDRGIITLDQGNDLWEQMLNKNRKLPAKTFSEYLEKEMYKDFPFT